MTTAEAYAEQSRRLQEQIDVLTRAYAEKLRMEALLLDRALSAEAERDRLAGAAQAIEDAARERVARAERVRDEEIRRRLAAEGRRNEVAAERDEAVAARVERDSARDMKMFLAPDDVLPMREQVARLRAAGDTLALRIGRIRRHMLSGGFVVSVRDDDAALAAWEEATRA